MMESRHIFRETATETFAKEDVAKVVKIMKTHYSLQ